VSADLKRLHKQLLVLEHIDFISDEMRAVIEDEWPELVYKLPPKKPQGRACNPKPKTKSPSSAGRPSRPIRLE
jgi:hypothetical protein